MGEHALDGLTEAADAVATYARITIDQDCSVMVIVTRPVGDGDDRLAVGIAADGCDVLETLTSAIDVVLRQRGLKGMLIPEPGRG